MFTAHSCNMLPLLRSDKKIKPSGISTKCNVGRMFLFLKLFAFRIGFRQIFLTKYDGAINDQVRLNKQLERPTTSLYSKCYNVLMG